MHNGTLKSRIQYSLVEMMMRDWKMKIDLKKKEKWRCEWWKIWEKWWINEL